MAKLKITILGCGSSVGVPIINANNDPNDACMHDWGNCDQNNPKNLRTRASIALQYNDNSIIIDTTPDFRQQILNNRVPNIKGILYTHAHADHANGIDDLRPLYFASNRETPHKRTPVNIYSYAEVIAELQHRFPYLFGHDKYHSNPKGVTTGILSANHIHHLQEFMVPGIDDLPILPFNQDHEVMITAGYRIKDMAYSTDVKRLDDAAFQALSGVKLWIVDCLCYNKSRSHSHLEQTLQWIERVKPQRAILTHMKNTMDYEELRRQLPANIDVAYDGMTIELEC